MRCACTISTGFWKLQARHIRNLLSKRLIARWLWVWWELPGCVSVALPGCICKSLRLDRVYREESTSGRLSKVWESLLVKHLCGCLRDGRVPPLGEQIGVATPRVIFEFKFRRLRGRYGSGGEANRPLPKFAPVHSLRERVVAEKHWIRKLSLRV